MLQRIAAVALLVVASCNQAPTNETTPPRTTSQTSPSLPSLGEVRPGTVIDVIDGDSLQVLVEGQGVEVRLVGINTPEKDECGGERAAADLEAIALDRAVTVSWEELDQFGRALAYVDVDADLDVAATQIATGNAIALSVDHPRFGRYADLEVDAFSNALGIWTRSCEPISNNDLRIAALAYDPDGPDGDNRNGEQVGIRNEGPDEVDLSDWVLRDESTRWRYRFPGGFTLDPQAGVVVHTGCGEDSETDLYWCAADPLWNNEGDTALLLDPGGNIVDRWAYGPKG